MRLKFTKVLSITALVFLAACGNKNSDGFEAKIDSDVVQHNVNDESTNKPEITFEETNFDFGIIKEGEKVTHAYTFKNTGSADLIIGDARGSCGCTVPKYPTQPIEPGESGVIDVEFNSAGKHGKQKKTISLVTNSIPSTKILTITGEVNPITE
jgi:hypothetical protein